MLRGIRIIPVLTGVALDWYLTIILSGGLGFAVAFSAAIHRTGTDHSQLVNLSHSPCFVIAGNILGTASSILGGFITGWMTGVERIKNGLVMGIVSAISSGLMVHFTEHHGVAYDIFMSCVTVGAGTLGGYLAKLAYDRPPRPPVERRA